MQVVLLSSDLMVVSRVQGAAAHAGSVVRIAAEATAAELHRDAPADMVIVDLATPGLELSTLVSQLRSNTSNSPRVLAFGPHVHENRLEAAQLAGCDVVLSRGQFFSQIDSLLGQQRLR
jgi:DNA-binding response OmpR family regulator